MHTFIFLLLYYYLISTNLSYFFFFFFNDTATTEIYTLSLHDALPISSKQDHGGKGNQAPAVDQKDRGDGQMGFAQPHGRAERLVHMKRDQYPADHAVDGIENPLPADGAERDGRNPGEQHEETQHAAAAKGLLQGDGQDARGDDDHDLRADREDEGVPDGNTETGALQNAAEVLQADKMQLGVADACVAEGIEYREQKGAGDQEQDVHNGRSKHGGPEHRAASRAGGLDAGPCYCNDTALGATRFSVERSKNFSSRCGTAKS